MWVEWMVAKTTLRGDDPIIAVIMMSTRMIRSHQDSSHLLPPPGSEQYIIAGRGCPLSIIGLNRRVQIITIYRLVSGVRSVISNQCNQLSPSLDDHYIMNLLYSPARYKSLILASRCLSPGGDAKLFFWQLFLSYR